jgi:uncharacterized Zn finger protein (UPF0148 family)
MGKHLCEECGSNWNANGYVVCPFCGSINVRV